MPTQQLQWIDKVVGDYQIEEMICDGPFSWIYKAAHRTRNADWLAIKISKPNDISGRAADAIVFPTAALTIGLGTVGRVNPDCAQLLLLQADKLRARSERLVKIQDINFHEDHCLLQMEWLKGRTLREVMRSGRLPLSLILELAHALDTLSRDEQFVTHGDLKPDNIMVTDDGIRLFDPGYFGPLDCREGALGACIITAPSYYPHLIADDLFALGIICWEAACHAHPMDGIRDSDRIDHSGIGEELYALVRSMEMTGQFFFTPILQCARPSIAQPGMSPEVEEFLLNAMRLKVCFDGKLELAPGFSSFTEMIAALQSLLKKNIDHF